MKFLHNIRIDRRKLSFNFVIPELWGFIHGKFDIFFKFCAITQLCTNIEISSQSKNFHDFHFCHSRVMVLYSWKPSVRQHLVQ